MTDTGVDAAATAWIERTAGGEVLDVVQVAGGGRSGFAVDVAVDAGEGGASAVPPTRRRGGVGSFMGFAREAEVYRALEPLGIPIPHVWGVDEDLDVFLVDRAEGQVWFRPPRDPEQAVAVAQDFMRHLATWHATPRRAGAADLRSGPFGAGAPARPARRHRGALRARGARPADRRARRAQLEHLLHHAPDFEGEAVLVQGDTGPGNFMYVDGCVTAIVDWELADVGDPMDDIVWLSWRATQQGWPDFTARLREYEAASGIAVDPAAGGTAG